MSTYLIINPMFFVCESSMQL